jgi:hypothetical protein
VTQTADERVRAGSADEIVIAGFPSKRVVAGVPSKDVVPDAAAHEIGAAGRIDRVIASSDHDDVAVRGSCDAIPLVCPDDRRDLEVANPAPSTRGGSGEPVGDIDPFNAARFRTEPLLGTIVVHVHVQVSPGSSQKSVPTSPDGPVGHEHLVSVSVGLRRLGWNDPGAGSSGLSFSAE